MGGRPEIGGPDNRSALSPHCLRGDRPVRRRLHRLGARRRISTSKDAGCFRSTPRIFPACDGPNSRWSICRPMRSWPVWRRIICTHSCATPRCIPSPRKTRREWRRWRPRASRWKNSLRHCTQRNAASGRTKLPTRSSNSPPARSRRNSNRCDVRGHRDKLQVGGRKSPGSEARSRGVIARANSSLMDEDRFWQSLAISQMSAFPGSCRPSGHDWTSPGVAVGRATLELRQWVTSAGSFRYRSVRCFSPRAVELRQLNRRPFAFVGHPWHSPRRCKPNCSANPGSDS